MDQFKTQLAAVKQHSFWAMCIGILAVSVGSWWVSTGKLKDEQAKQISAIDQGFQSLTTIKGTADHPNPTTNAGMDALNRKYAQEVAAGWKLQYEQQVDVLQWPEGFEQSGFKKFVDELRPIEKLTVTDGRVNIKQDIPRDFKEEYRNYMEDELPKLAKIIGARWMVSTLGDPNAGGGGMPGGMPGGPGGFSGLAGGAPGALGPGGVPMAGGLDASGMPMVIDDSVVLWDPANQNEILNTHFGFTLPNRNALPTTLEVLYAQEDYWVFDNIMQIIRETNKVDEREGKPIYASARHEAVIKRIDFIRIGRSARGLAGKVVPVGRSSTTGEMGGMPSPGGESGTTAPPGGTADAGTAPPGGDGMGGMETMLARDPAMYRYVDDKFQPLDPAKLRGALTSKSPEDALFAVAKRMPVRIAVSIDQRRLNLLLAECGNSKLPVEVHQVRINRPLTPAAAGGGGSYAGAMGGGGDMPAGPGGGGFTGGGFGGGPGSSDSGGGGFGGAFGGGGGGGFGGSTFGGGMAGGYSPPGGGGEYGGMPMGGMGGMGAGRSAYQAGSATQDAQVDPNMIEVELYGIVYIYNPVNLGLLGLDQPAPGGEPGATPQPQPETPPVDAAVNTNPAPPVTQTVAAPGAE